jgi:hypothetical protein
MQDIYPQEADFRLYKKIVVWIKTSSDQRYSLMVNESITVGRLKEMLHAKFGIDADNKRL